MLNPNDIAAFEKEKLLVLSEWEKHKSSPECLGKDCPKCKEYQEWLDTAKPLK